MSEIYYAREPNHGASELWAGEILATRQFVAAISSDANLGSPAELLLASVTDDELRFEPTSLFDRLERDFQGFSQQALLQIVDRVSGEEAILRHGVASKRATRLLFNLSKIVETPDEIAFMANLWNDPGFSRLSGGNVPTQRKIFHLGLKVADSYPEHAVSIGAAAASMVKPPSSARRYDFDPASDTEVTIREGSRHYKHAVESGSEGEAAFVLAYLQNRPPKHDVRYTLSEIVRVLSALESGGGTHKVNEMANLLEAYKMGILEPRKKQKDSLPQSGDCVRAAAALTVNLIDYLSHGQPEYTNANKLKRLLDSQRVAHRDMLGSDMAFITIANGILRGSGSEALPGKSIEAFNQALGIVIDAAIADSRLKGKNEYADLVRSCSNRLIEIAILRNNFLPKVTADAKAIPPGKVPAIKTTTRGEYRNSKDARTPGYGTIS